MLRSEMPQIIERKREKEREIVSANGTLLFAWAAPIDYNKI